MFERMPNLTNYNGGKIRRTIDYNENNSRNNRKNEKKILSRHVFLDHQKFSDEKK